MGVDGIGIAKSYECLTSLDPTRRCLELWLCTGFHGEWRISVFCDVSEEKRMQMEKNVKN